MTTCTVFFLRQLRFSACKSRLTYESMDWHLPLRSVEHRRKTARANLRPIQITGTVLDPTGAAVVGADVRLQAATPEQTTTDQQGAFTFPLRRRMAPTRSPSTPTDSPIAR